MLRTYNRSRDAGECGASFDPDFWEVPVEPEILSQFAIEQGAHHESPAEPGERRRRNDWIGTWMPRILQALEEVLTSRQREVVRMYFLDSLTVYEIAERLGVSPPCVSQHLFGRSRGGKRVGGAIPKLRRAMEVYSQ